MHYAFCIMRWTLDYALNNICDVLNKTNFSNSPSSSSLRIFFLRNKLLNRYSQIFAIILPKELSPPKPWQIAERANLLSHRQKVSLELVRNKPFHALRRMRMNSTFLNTFWNYNSSCWLLFYYGSFEESSEKWVSENTTFSYAQRST